MTDDSNPSGDNSKSTGIHDYMGVYKRLEHVPERYRLRNFGGKYAGEDVWGSWFDQHADPDWVDRTFHEYERVEDSWKEHMSNRDRHHALSTPEDVEAWVVHLLDERDYSIEYAWDRWWSRVEQFYRWLYYHAEHPHVYNPVWIAAAELPASRKMWARRMKRTRR